MTTVLFVCPNCGAGYQVTQEWRAIEASGTFGCRICRTEIYSWSGNYDYFDWKAFEANTKRCRQRRKNKQNPPPGGWPPEEVSAGVAPLPGDTGNTAKTADAS